MDVATRWSKLVHCKSWTVVAGGDVSTESVHSAFIVDPICIVIFRLAVSISLGSLLHTETRPDVLCSRGVKEREIKEELDGNH